MDLTVVICTHNRLALLRHTLRSINQAERPVGLNIHVLVIANACNDGTVEWLRSRANGEPTATLPLGWSDEPAAGKSYALNHAISLLKTPVVTFVDDDHQVARDYFSAIDRALNEWPAVGLFCGRVKPDWDGSEPSWVHDTGPYRIYPLPIPDWDLGDTPQLVTAGMKLPGGGNLVARTKVFQIVGSFRTDLGPRGNGLAGSEDTDFVLRTLAAGETLRYVPDIRQAHYVDPSRLRLTYLLRKAFHRSRTVVQVRAQIPKRVPLYLWRKAGGYAVRALTSWRVARTRFFLVRLSAALGEIRGIIEARRNPPHSSLGHTNGPK